MKLGMEVGLGPGHIVLDGDPATLSKKGGGTPHKSQLKAPHPIFGSSLL